MNKRLVGPIVAALVMALSAGAAYALKPRVKLADEGAKVDLEKIVPKAFGQWKIDPNVVPVQVSPDIQAKLDQIYNQTLSRTYINASGERVMLTIAYGGDQSDSTQMHRPEICYAAQGFQVGSIVRGFMDLSANELPVVRLVAAQGARVEPITYWMTVGDRAVRTMLEHKMAQLKYGLSGQVPDGLLFRVSSIDRDSNRAYALHEMFVEQLIADLSQDSRLRLVGRLGV